MEETNTTRPRPRAIMPGTSSLVSSIGAVRLTATSSATWPAVICPIGPAQPRPALLTRMSIPAEASPAPGAGGRTAAARWAAAARSAGPAGAARSQARAMPPVWAATAARRAGSLPAISGRAPAAASARTVAAPMPDDPPVTSATVPVSRMASHFRVPGAPPQGGPGRSGTDRGGLGRVEDAGLGPAAHAVAHGQQPGHLVALDHHEVPEPRPDHGRRGLLQRPVGRRVHDVQRPVRRGQFGVGILPGAEGVEDVAFGQDAHARVLRVDHHRRTH